MKRNSIIAAAAVVVILAIAFFVHRSGDPAPRADLIPVKFGVLPYADHTYAIIGAEKGWFEEAGIDIDISLVQIDEAVSRLKSSLDVVSIPPGILLSSYSDKGNRDLRTFVFGDLFQGYALLAQPDAGLKSYAEFRADGLSHTDAVREAARQLSGRRFAYPSETAIKPFIDFLLSKGGLSRDDFESVVLDDPLTVNAMRNKQADFQVGGVPSRLTLEKEGYKVIISSIDLAKGAAPTAESEELASILQNGWATTGAYHDANPELILRLAGVNYRIMEFMNSNQAEAIDIHMKYLSKITGQSFDAEDGKVIYESLDPFITFENQRPWFYDSSNPLYYQHLNGSIIRSFVKSGIYEGSPPEVDDVIYADDIYRELEKLRGETLGLIEKLNERGDSESSEAAEKASALLKAYNFVDAAAVARKATEASE